MLNAEQAAWLLELAAGCLCGWCDPICKYALFRPCCGACRNDGGGADAGWAEWHAAQGVTA